MEDQLYRAELVTFSCKECYVYKPPPASSIGHRAEFWDVDHWLQEVSLKIVTCDEDCTIRLFEQKTGALYAECIVPSEAPLSTVVEAVVDSSRYFAIRLEDRQSKRHAVIGIGFRERTEASDFNAALYEHMQYLRRKKEAAEMREAYTANAEDPDGPASTSQIDMSLKPGETITLKLAKTQLSSPGSAPPVLPRHNSNTSRLPQFRNLDSSPGQIPILAPPPAGANATGASSAQQLHHMLSGQGEQPDRGPDSAAAALEAAPTQPSPQAVQQGSAPNAPDPQLAAGIKVQHTGEQTGSGDSGTADDWGDFVT